MSGREVREYTNLSDPKDRKWGKGKDKIDDEDITFQRMVAKGFWRSTGWLMLTDAGGCWRAWRLSTWARRYFMFHFCRKDLCNFLIYLFLLFLLRYSALDSDDLLYLKEQMEAEEDAERLLRRTEKRAFAAFKKAASLADSTPAVPLALRVEPKPKSDIRQQDLLKNIVEIKPKRPRASSPSQQSQSNKLSQNHEDSASKISSSQGALLGEKGSSFGSAEYPLSVGQPMSKTIEPTEAKPHNATGSLLGLAYESSDEEQ